MGETDSGVAAASAGRDAGIRFAVRKKNVTRNAEGVATLQPGHRIPRTSAVAETPSSEDSGRCILVRGTCPMSNVNGVVSSIL